jgi:hypothetical protein
MTQAMLDERYGRTRSKRRRVLGWGVVAVIAAAAIGWLAWTTIANSLHAVDTAGTGFELVDAHTVTVRFQATVNPGTPITCILEAQDEQHGVVGWRIVEYPASGDHTRVFTETIPTVAMATTGLVNACWVA